MDRLDRKVPKDSRELPALLVLKALLVLLVWRAQKETKGIPAPQARLDLKVLPVLPALLVLKALLVPLVHKVQQGLTGRTGLAS